MIAKFTVLVLLVYLWCSAAFAKEVLTQEEKSKIYRFRPMLITEVLAKPEQYDGKEIAVEGFVTDMPEDQNIYLSKDYADHLIHAGRLSFDVRSPGPCIRGEGPDYQMKWENFSFPKGNDRGKMGAYAMVVGTFKAPAPGSETAGHLKDVWFILHHDSERRNSIVQVPTRKKSIKGQKR